MLAACATPAFDIAGADPLVTPRQAAGNLAALRDRTVAWGGVIVAAKNLKDNTQFEVLGYPLDDQNRPKRETDPLGRFIVVHPGYLETADYAPGRLITVVGKLTETRTGTVGEAQYVYPVVGVSRMHLWPRQQEERREPSIHFGIGIGIIRSPPAVRGTPPSSGAGDIPPTFPPKINPADHVLPPGPARGLTTFGCGWRFSR